MPRTQVSSDIPRKGARGTTCWAETVWDSVYFRIPSAPCRRERPEAFMPPMGAATLPQAAP